MAPEVCASGVAAGGDADGSSGTTGTDDTSPQSAFCKSEGSPVAETDDSSDLAQLSRDLAQLRAENDALEQANNKKRAVIARILAVKSLSSSIVVNSGGAIVRSTDTKQELEAGTKEIAQGASHSGDEDEEEGWE